MMKVPPGSALISGRTLPGGRTLGESVQPKERHASLLQVNIICLRKTRARQPTFGYLPHFSWSTQNRVFWRMRKRPEDLASAMNPSRGMLAVFRASLRLMDEETLAELRGRFVELKEHPKAIAAIDRELARRNRRS